MAECSASAGGSRSTDDGLSKDGDAKPSEETSAMTREEAGKGFQVALKCYGHYKHFLFRATATKEEKDSFEEKLVFSLV